MQRAVLQRATFTDHHPQATRVVANQVSDLGDEAVNDACYQDEASPLKLALAVLGNVIGGSLLLSGMFFLPQLVARIFN